MSDNSTQRATLQLLRDLSRAGVTHLPHWDAAIAMAASENGPAIETDARADEASPPEIHSEQIPEADSQTDRVNPSTSHDTAILPENQSPVSDVTSPDQPVLPAKTLTELAERVATCTRCQELAEQRTQTVFGVGNPNAKIMFIGEAPGADEDRQGEPFVGKAGQLLNRIIEACGWKRPDLYICNILRCRPPGNRNPTPEEASNCREYLDGQIELVQPEYIVCWGSVAAKNLLNQDVSIGKMRGKFFDYRNAKVLCTYHPSYLLRNPEAKKPVWEDMKLLMAKIESDARD
ncbi:Uracil DNA glycosylase superfamily protein [Thalassoglobus neptunius]|uniref:Type-4 uracil-DNA glycosylase n=1 Tax=Thalassoglobus neptunius TaxID=1938619 RepID=A0A5C5WPA6_9PLAN|nr:uracil-DNA glycosylase [Thalassoglobus neptunius]TWT51989.1 Uracil DNA glycosylase superfamily protein [Thalassoglobus neptunius]